MRSFRRVHHDAARLQWNGPSDIEAVAGAGVPGSLQHGYIPGVGVPMRNIHDVRRKPDPNHIDAGFSGIPEQYRLLHSVPIRNIVPVNIRRRYSNEIGPFFATPVTAAVTAPMTIRKAAKARVDCACTVCLGMLFSVTLLILTCTQVERQ